MSGRQLFTVLIWVNPGELDTLHEYERRARPLIEQHGGSFVRVMSVSACTPDDAFASPPDEIHILEFSGEDAFTSYRNDPQAIALAPLRETAVHKAIFLSGEPATTFDQA